jgi:hypothetical protein
MPKIFPLFGKFPIASILIALSMTVDTFVLAEPTKAPIPTPAPSNQPAPAPIPTPLPTNQSTNPVNQKLIGRWQAKDASLDNTLSLVFSPDGKLYILLPDSENPLAIAFNYQINPKPQPMHLDVTVSKEEKPVLTIFELTADDQMRLQLDNTSPGQPRPQAFLPTATLFTKVSDSTKLPENIKLIDPGS